MGLASGPVQVVTLVLRFWVRVWPDYRGNYILPAVLITMLFNEPTMPSEQN